MPVNKIEFYVSVSDWLFYHRFNGDFIVKRFPFCDFL